MKTYVPRKSCTQILIATVFKIAQTRHNLNVHPLKKKNGTFRISYSKKNYNKIKRMESQYILVNLKHYTKEEIPT